MFNIEAEDGKLMVGFDQNGFLTPYSPIPANIDQLERFFVEEFSSSTTRRVHFERFREYNTRLNEYLPGGLFQWVDGSFVSSKLNPNDLDVLTFVDNALYTQHERNLRPLKEEFAKGTGGRVDAHLIRVYPEGHTHRHLYESDRVQWLFDWSRTAIRPRKNKGFIELITV